MRRLIFIFLIALVVAAEDAEASSHDQCDETKCRSPGIFGEEYDCWAVDDPQTWKPYACADGYEVQDLSNVTTLYDPQSNATFRFFTCCSPGYRSSPMLEQCTDTACSSGSTFGETDCWADGPDEPMTCEGDVYPYPHKTGAKVLHYSWYYWHYVCCKTSSGTPPLNRTLVVAEVVRIVLGSLALFFILILVLGICLSRIARSRTYNLYLISLAIPDAFFNIIGIIMGSFSVSGRSLSWEAVNFAVYFYSAANIWLNTAVAYQLYTLLRNSHRRKRTRPPSLKCIGIQTAVIYFFALLYATWMMFLLGRGIQDLANERNGMVAVALSFVVMAVAPCLYFIYISVRVWRDKLLPLNGQTRALSLYFLRIVVFFFIFWIPCIVIHNFEKSNRRNHKIV